MPIYHSLGKIPQKRHTQFRKPDNSLFHEQLFGTIGFEGMSSLLYHMYRPTMVKEIGEPKDLAPTISEEKHIKARKLISFNIAPEDDFLDSRKILMVNKDVQIGVAAPKSSLQNYFYKNADADELLFIHQGSGTLRTMFGQIDFVPGDYLVIPRGTIYQISFGDHSNRLLFAESFHPI